MFLPFRNVGELWTNDDKCGIKRQRRQSQSRKKSFSRLAFAMLIKKACLGD